MNTVPFVLSAIAVAVLAGCASESRITPAPAPVVVVAPQPAPYVLAPAPAGMVVVPQASVGTVVVAPAPIALRSGFGRIESILAIPSAAAGGTAAINSRRIVMRMDDGTVQYFDTGAAGLAVGDRVEITPDGTLRHPA